MRLKNYLCKGHSALGAVSRGKKIIYVAPLNKAARPKKTSRG